jgi:hypothetical protein
MSPRTLRLLPLALAGLALLTSCTPALRDDHWASVRELTPAAFAEWAVYDPGLAAGVGGRVALTYVTRDTAGADAWIVVSADSGMHFSAPLRLNARAGKVSSFPESRPVAAYGPGGRLVVAWASARDSGRFADDIVARTSGDGGATFEPEVILNDDGSLPRSTYHGFVALDVTAQGRVLAAWIDGRAASLAPGEEEPLVAQVWSAASDDGGRRWRANVLVADSVCPCCRPTLRASATGLVAVAYRGVRDSLRDPHLAISRDGGATFGRDTLLSADGWRLAACPVAGPAMTLARDGGFVAWYTGARGTDGGGPGVYVAPWLAGEGPAGPRRALAEPALEAAHPLLVTLGPVTLAGVLTRPAKGRHALGLRTLAADGTSSPWLFLGANARSATLAGTDSRRAFAAWLEQTDAGPRLRLARITRG